MVIRPFRALSSFSIIISLILGTVINIAVVPNKAAAWTENTLPNCDTTIMEWDLPYAITHPNSTSTPTNPEHLLNFDHLQESYAVYQAGGPDYQYLLYAPGGKVNFGSDATGHYLSPDVTAYRHTVSNDNSNNTAVEDRVSNTYATHAAGTKLYNPTCIFAAPNVKYMTSYTGTMYNTDLPYTPNGTTGTCDTLDFGCWLTNVFSNIEDTFLSVGQAIVKAVAFIFVPDGDFWSHKISEVKTAFTTQFGILAYPLEYFTSLFNAFTNPNTNWCDDVTCSRTFGTLFGQEYTVNFLEAKTFAPTIWSFIIVTIRGITIFLLLIMLRKKYMDMILS